MSVEAKAPAKLTPERIDRLRRVVKIAERMHVLVDSAPKGVVPTVPMADYLTMAAAVSELLDHIDHQPHARPGAGR